jgi:hypothetical protein
MRQGEVAAMTDKSVAAPAAPLAGHKMCASDEELDAAQEQSRDIAASAAESAQSLEPPEDFFDNVFDCLIMEEPVFAMDGFTYERKRIEEWLANNSRLVPVLQPFAPSNSLHVRL